MERIVITNKGKLSCSHKDENVKYEYFKYVLDKKALDNQCTVAFYDIPPKKSNYPYHYHRNDVEVFYIISGIGILETEEGEKEIKTGDLIVCPPTKLGAHKITNTSNSNMLSYIEFDTKHDPEITKYPHSNKIGILDSEDGNANYLETEKVNYYDGE